MRFFFVRLEQFYVISSPMIAVSSKTTQEFLKGCGVSVQKLLFVLHSKDWLPRYGQNKKFYIAGNGASWCPYFWLHILVINASIEKWTIYLERCAIPFHEVWDRFAWCGDRWWQNYEKDGPHFKDCLFLAILGNHSNNNTLMSNYDWTNLSGPPVVSSPIVSTRLWNPLHRCPRRSASLHEPGFHKGVRGRVPRFDSSHWGLLS